MYNPRISIWWKHVTQATGKSEETLRKEIRLLKKRVLKYIAIGMKHDEVSDILNQEYTRFKRDVYGSEKVTYHDSLLDDMLTVKQKLDDLSALADEI